MICYNRALKFWAVPGKGHPTGFPQYPPVFQTFIRAVINILQVIKTIFLGSDTCWLESCVPSAMATQWIPKDPQMFVVFCINHDLKKSKNMLRTQLTTKKQVGPSNRKTGQLLLSRCHHLLRRGPNPAPAGPGPLEAKPPTSPPVLGPAGTTCMS